MAEGSDRRAQREDRVNPAADRAAARTSGKRERTIGKKIRIVYEDEDVLIVDKPSGIVTADPAHSMGASKSMRPSARVGDTVFDAAKKHVREGVGKKRRRREDGNADLGRVWIIHRLDKEASGLLVFAKSQRAFTSLKDAFKAKTARREYVAVCEGIVGAVGFTGTRRSMIDEDRGPRKTGGSSREGDRDDAGEDDGKKLAITHYRVEAAGNGRTLLRVKLETGRKNQIRVHMQELGHPLIGDKRFGASADPIGRVALHAAMLGFDHPSNVREPGRPLPRHAQPVRGPMLFESPVPPAFLKAVGIKTAAVDADEQETAAPQSKQPPAPLRDRAASPVLKDADTSWNAVAEWYDELLEDKGNDHFEQTILPGVLKLLAPKPGERILDAACGQGMLTRRLAALGAHVTGVDAAPRLIAAAKERSASTGPREVKIDYFVGDARELHTLGASSGSGPKTGTFDAVTCIMALTNIDPLEDALRSMAAMLKPGGRLVAVVSHPAFRIPGASDWGWDDKARRQYRRIDAYLTPFTRNIQMHPGKAAAGKRGGELATPTFHRPLSAYINALSGAGLKIERMDEWASARAASSGPRAPEENRMRVEVPLFAAVVASR